MDARILEHGFLKLYAKGARKYSKVKAVVCEVFYIFVRFCVIALDLSSTAAKNGNDFEADSCVVHYLRSTVL